MREVWIEAMQLVKWMKAAGLTCEEMAQKVGCATSTISRLIPKSGKKQMRLPSLELAARIAAATSGQVTANDFVDGDVEPVTLPGRVHREAAR